MQIISSSKIYLLGLVLIAVSACAKNSPFNQLGSSLLSSTGLVSQSQADAFMKAGGEIVEASRPISDEEEYYLGRSVAAMVLGKYAPVRNDRLNSYVNKVGATVVAYSDRTETFGGYHFLVVESDEINAMSTPGGFVFITKAILNRMPNEDALAAVLAHEVGHIVKDHGMNAISQAHLAEAVSVIGRERISSTGGVTAQALDAAFGDSVGDVFKTLTEKGYSRSQEYEADEYAAELLHRAGYNPEAIVTMLRSLEHLDGHGGWFATHPSVAKRIDEVEGSIVASPVAAKNEPIRTQRFKGVVHGGQKAKS